MLKKTLRYAGILLSGLLIAAILYTGYKEVGNSYYLASPIENVFEVQKVIVPDFTLGEDPNVVYERLISRSFVGDFIVEVKSPETNETICFNGAKGIKYSAGEEHIPIVNLSWFLFAKDLKSACPELTTGQYYLETNYTIHIEGLPDRHVVNLSNVFEVLPATPRQCCRPFP